MSEPVPDLQTLRDKIAALPSRLRVADTNTDEPAKADGALAVIARQGRLILRLTAAVENTEARLKADSDHPTHADVQNAIERGAEETRRVLREAVLPLMDALDFAAQTAQTRDDAGLTGALNAARRDGLRRLAGVGIAEIPASVGTPFDGRLHEAVESRPPPDDSPAKQYEILAVVRPGYQRGTEILRRASVVTAQ